MVREWLERPPSGLTSPTFASTSPQGSGLIFLKVCIKSHHFPDYPFKGISLSLKCKFKMARQALQPLPQYPSPSDHSHFPSNSRLDLSFQLLKQHVLFISQTSYLPPPWSSLCRQPFSLFSSLAKSHPTAEKWLWHVDQIRCAGFALLQHLGFPQPALQSIVILCWMPAFLNRV